MKPQAATYPVKDVAKMLGIGTNKLFRRLREAKVLNKENIPYQSYISRGLFSVYHGTWNHPVTGTHHYAKTQITDQGINWLQQLINQEQTQ